MRVMALAALAVLAVGMGTGVATGAEGEAESRSMAAEQRSLPTAGDSASSGGALDPMVGEWAYDDEASERWAKVIARKKELRGLLENCSSNLSVEEPRPCAVDPLTWTFESQEDPLWVPRLQVDPNQDPRACLVAGGTWADCLRSEATTTDGSPEATYQDTVKRVIGKSPIGGLWAPSPFDLLDAQPAPEVGGVVGRALAY